MKNALRKNTNATATGDDPLQFIMSDSGKDRYGDVVEADGWILDEFLKNPVALANHDPSFIIGTWEDVHKEGTRLLGRLKMAAMGTSARIDELRKLVFAGILRACSVGFIPEEATPIPGGMRYTKHRLIECSIVATPANANALRAESKALGVSELTIRKLIDRPPVNGSLAQRQEHARIMALAAAAMEPVKSAAPTKQRMSPEEIKAKIARAKAKQREQYAAPQTQTFGGEVVYEPELFFNGQPNFRKKGKFGW